MISRQTAFEDALMIAQELWAQGETTLHLCVERKRLYVGVNAPSGFADGSGTPTSFSFSSEEELATAFKDDFVKSQFTE